MISYENDNDSDAVNESCIFDNLQKVKNSVYANVKKLNYEIVILRSHLDRKIDEIRRVDMICNRSTTYKETLSENPRLKNSSFVKIACLWKIVLIKYKNKKKWQLKIVDSNHNHESAKKLFVLTDHRRRDLTIVYETIDQIANQTSITIFDNLRANNSNIIVQFKNIVNARARFRNRRLDKYISIQTLLKALYRNNWFMKFVLKINIKRVSNRYSTSFNCKTNWFLNKWKDSSSLTNTWSKFYAKISKSLLWIASTKSTNIECHCLLSWITLL